MYWSAKRGGGSATRAGLSIKEERQRLGIITRRKPLISMIISLASYRLPYQRKSSKKTRIPVSSWPQHRRDKVYWQKGPLKSTEVLVPWALPIKVSGTTVQIGKRFDSTRARDSGRIIMKEVLARMVASQAWAVWHKSSSHSGSRVYRAQSLIPSIKYRRT